MGKVTVNINKFLGLNEQGNTQLQLGEAEVMTNFRLVDEYKPRVIEGYVELFTSIAADKPIRGMWYGEINSTFHFLFACNGHVYDLDLIDNTYDDLGTLTDAYTNFFFFDSKVYIQNGNEYYKWTGTGTITEVTGYVPIIAIVTPPAGGGTAYEGVNLLTGEKRQWFSGDGTATVFQCAETGLTSIDYVKNLVTGLNYVLTSDYTVDLTNGKVTFTTAPPNSANNVEIKWTKGTGNRSSIEKCRGEISYNGANDTRIFLWGDTDHQNRRYHSGLADINDTGFGIPSAEYFPATNYYDIGSNENAVTDIVKQYDRQIVFTDGGKAYYSYYELSDSSPTFPVYPLNDSIGNVAFGQARLILNNPFTVYKGIYQWSATSVRDERNAVYMSNRVHPSMDSIYLSQAITVDHEKNGEYWVSVGSTIWIYNYRLDAWYKFLLTDTPSSFIEIDGVLYFGTTQGQIMKFDDALRSFNGSHIVSELCMGFTDASAPNRTKYLEESHVALKAESHVELDVYWETNKKMPKDVPKTIGYNNLVFDDVNFDDWSFDGNYNPQPFKVKSKAKNWVYFRHIFKLDSDYYTAQILEITFEPNIGGISK